MKEEEVACRNPEEIVLQQKESSKADACEEEMLTVVCETGFHIPVPELSEEINDGLELREEVLQDISLKKFREWAVQKENG